MNNMSKHGVFAVQLGLVEGREGLLEEVWGMSMEKAGVEI